MTAYDKSTPLADVINDPIFGDYGRLIFPVNDWYYSGDTLGDLRLTWYNNIDPDKTAEITNYLKEQVTSGNTVFYDIYTEEEKHADPDKNDTGLFFFKGTPGEKFAVCNAGGGFAYVGAMQDSFPHALELSKLGYNAFALIYRPDAQSACKDLSRAIAFIFDHAEELEVDISDYSLWGGSAGGRMAAWVASYGTAAFGAEDLPRPAAVIMQYTGHSEYSQFDPPTFACVGESDGIASWQLMKRRLELLSDMGINTEFHSYPNLRHGFGIGTGTVAEGWINQAVAFWEKQMNQEVSHVNEKAVGRAMKKSGIAREDIFLETKLWPAFYEQADTVEKTLQRLDTDYIDLLLIHQPSGNYIAGYKLMEKAYKEGKVKAIGLSNFSVEQIKEILSICEVKPTVLQTEVHPYHQETELKVFLKENGMVAQAWYPLGHGDQALLEEPLFAQLGKKYGKSAPQIILRWHTQVGNIVIPGSKNPDHIKANFDLFDIELAAEELSAILDMNKNVRYYTSTPDMLKGYAQWIPPVDEQK